MPSYGPEVLGPPARQADQQHWDPEMQTMAPERRRELQLERLRTLVDRSLGGPVGLFARKLGEAGITSGNDLTSLEDVNRIPTTLKQDLRDSEAEHPPMGDYRFTPLSECVRIGQSTGTTGTPTVTVLTRHDLFIEYESAARNWWRNGWRPGQVVTHCHPAYLYGGGLMLSGTLEYFGFLNLWVPPPETDELAEQAIKIWQRIHPDLQMVTLSQHRFQEVAAKMGVDLVEDCGFPNFSMGGFGRGLMPMMTAGLRVLRLPGRPGLGVRRGPPARGLGHHPGHRPRDRPGRPRRPVGQPGGHHPRPRQRPAPLRPGGGRHVGGQQLPAGRDVPASASGAGGSRTC